MIDAKEIKLLPCPFCGSKEVRVVTDHGYYRVKCQECLSETGPSKTLALIEHYWNMRTEAEE